MKAAFATCVQLGLSCIEEIYRQGGSLNLLITLEDEKAKKKSGRIFLDALAEEKGIPLLKIKNINESVVLHRLKEMEIDWFFIIGWSQIAMPELLTIPKLGCVGMHPTLLPQGRGRAAIPWAILKDLRQTGVTLFKLEAGLDSGPMGAQKIIDIAPEETASTLYSKIKDAHIRLMGESWQGFCENNITWIPQDESKATYWPERKPQDGEIFSSMTIDAAVRLVRAVTAPYPGAFYRMQHRVLRIWSAKKKTHADAVDDSFPQIHLQDGILLPIHFTIEEGVFPESHIHPEQEGETDVANNK